MKGRGILNRGKRSNIRKKLKKKKKKKKWDELPRWANITLLLNKFKV